MKQTASVVTETVTRLEDTSVATGTVSDLLSNGAEEFLDSKLILQLSEDDTTCVRGVFLSAGQQGLDVYAKSLSLSDRGEDALVQDERCSHVGKHSLAVRLLTTEMIEFLIMSPSFYLVII